METVILAAGGTGGHIMPALAVARELKEREQLRVVFVGVGRPIEDKLIRNAGYELKQIAFSPVVGKGVLGAVKMLLSFPGAVFKVFNIYRQVKPVAVIGFGGYPAIVPILVAFVLRIPALLQEQNVQVGLANKFLSLFVKRIFAPKGAEKGFLKNNHVVLCPNPVRREFYSINKELPNLENRQFRLLVLGGSQGAVSVNNAVLNLTPLFRELSIDLIHQTGELDYKRVCEGFDKYGFKPYEVVSFIDDIVSVLSRADLVISRAGAMAVAEIVAARVPAIFIPLTIAKAHQEMNVSELVAAGGAFLIRQDENLSANLERELRAIMNNKNRLAQIEERLKQIALPSDKLPVEVIVSEINKVRRKSQIPPNS